MCGLATGGPGGGPGRGTHGGGQTARGCGLILRAKMQTAQTALRLLEQGAENSIT